MLYSPFLWWLVVHKSAKQTTMMDFQIDLEGWLEESTLFPNVQQTCHRPVSDLFPESKDLPAVSSIGDGWLDEKLDLSIFDFQDNWLEPQNDSGKMMAEDASISIILDSLMGSNPVSADIFDTENGNVKILPDFENVACEVFVEESIPSPEENDLNSCVEEANTPPSEDLSSSVSSPTSSVCSSYSDLLVSPKEEKIGYSDLLASPKEEKILDYTKLLNESYLVPSPNFEEISDDAESDQSSVGPILSASTKIRKTTPYVSKKEARRERKKIQNKEAAARYRTKKRIQDKELSIVVQKLESDQKALQTKHDQLKNEISYLKSLMREVFQRKGLLK